METGLAESLRELSQCVGRIEGKVDGIQESQREFASRTEERVAALEKQLGHWKGWVAGVAAAVSFLIATVKEFLR